MMHKAPATHRAPAGFQNETGSRTVFDVFCYVIDNYGDIGTSWRLTRQLASFSARHHIRLWVNDLTAFKRIEPSVTKTDRQAWSKQITLLHWHERQNVEHAGDIVIEAFGCNLPLHFIDQMVRKNSLWFNLEYLSAEPWVENCHALPSLQANGLRKYFFFPGFTPVTGGLLREKELLDKRNNWLNEPNLRWQFLSQLNVPESLISLLKNGARQILLFNYPNAPVNALVRSLGRQHTPSIIIQPQGTGPSFSIPPRLNVHQVTVPFMPQASFDSLLWSSDLNLVRGEDSLVRAIWAGKPLIWHIYPQSDQAHLGKLLAWLQLSPFPQLAADLNMAWNRGSLKTCETLFSTLLEREGTLEEWENTSQAWAKSLAEQPDLAMSLMALCTHILGTR